MEKEYEWKDTGEESAREREIKKLKSTRSLVSSFLPSSIYARATTHHRTKLGWLHVSVVNL